MLSPRPNASNRKAVRAGLPRSRGPPAPPAATQAHGREAANITAHPVPTCPHEASGAVLSRAATRSRHVGAHAVASTATAHTRAKTMHMIKYRQDEDLKRRHVLKAIYALRP